MTDESGPFRLISLQRTSPSDAKQNKYNFIRAISEEQYDQLRQASTDVDRYLNGTTIRHLRLSDSRLKLLFDDWQADLARGRSPAADPDPMLLINHEVLTWLSMFGLFLDHTESKIARAYRDKSEVVDEYRRMTSAAFDGIFAYRFCCKLRNHSLHYELPITHLNFSTSEAAAPTMTLAFRVTTLLENRSGWGARVRGELQALDKDLELVPVFRSALAAAEQLELKSRDLLFPQILSSVEALLAVESDFVANPGSPGVGSISVVDADGGLSIQLSPLNIAGARRIREIRGSDIA